MAVIHLVVGPEEHGVTRCALDLHDTPALRRDPLVRVPGRLPDDTPDRLIHQGVHVHVTDRLFGDSAPEAADVLESLGHGLALTVTLHDVPQSSDGPGGFERRAAAYARIVEASRGVVVSSEHESLLLDEALRAAGRGDLVGERPRAVIPLPIDTPDLTLVPTPSRRHREPRDLVVLGYLYPGKGHEEALEALADLPPDVGLLALGRPSPGHEDLVDSLSARGAELGRRVEVTGYVPDDELTDRLQGVAVPVAPHRHLSASGSINSWLAAGRRPLVPRSRYVEELEARCPGALFVYDDLAEAARAALDDARLTWLPPGVRLVPSRVEAGEAYAEVLERWHP